jgi:hypothetical protein
MKREPLDAVVFLAGPPVRQRTLFRAASADHAPVLTPAGASVLFWDDPANGGGRTAGSSSVETSWIGVADGAYAAQPLLAQTGLRAATSGALNQPCVIWAGDGDSGPQGPLAAERRRRALHAQFGGMVQEHDLQTSKDLSDGAYLLDQLAARIGQWAHQHTEQGSLVPFVAEVIGAFGGRRDHERAMFEECLLLISCCGWPVVLIMQPDSVLFNGPLVVQTAASGCGFGLLAHYPKSAQHMDAASGAGSAAKKIESSSVAVRLAGARYGGEFVLQRPSHGSSNQISGCVLGVEPQACVHQPGAAVFELILTGGVPSAHEA